MSGGEEGNQKFARAVGGGTGNPVSRQERQWRGSISSKPFLYKNMAMPHQINHTVSLSASITQRLIPMNALYIGSPYLLLQFLCRLPETIQFFRKDSRLRRQNLLPCPPKSYCSSHNSFRLVCKSSRCFAFSTLFSFSATTFWIFSRRLAK